MSVFKKSLAAVSVGVATVVLWASSANAQRIGGNISDRNGGRANADAGWNWVGTKSLQNIFVGVDDLRCDDEGAYAFLKVYGRNGPLRNEVHRVKDGCGGGPTYKRGLSYSNANDIIGVQLILCVDSFGRDTCFESAIVRR